MFGTIYYALYVALILIQIIFNILKSVVCAVYSVLSTTKQYYIVVTLLTY